MERESGENRETKRYRIPKFSRIVLITRQCTADFANRNSCVAHENVNETLRVETTLNVARVCGARMRISVSLGFHFATERHFTMSHASTNSNFGEVQSLQVLHLSATTVTDICIAAIRSRRSRCGNISCQHKHGFENSAPSRVTMLLASPISSRREPFPRRYARVHHPSKIHLFARYSCQRAN